MSTSLLDEPAVRPSTSPAQRLRTSTEWSETSAESVERLRSWASGRCLSADKPGIYNFDAGNGKARRKIPRDPSLN